ncbi:6760_t:CDS:2, partial [Funneliformis geosporum]
YLAVRDKLLELINSLLKEEELKKQLKQDKVHIQKELNDALTILNKPTAEMGTQTDLTAEQKKINKHRFHFGVFDGNPVKVKEINRELIKESEHNKNYIVEYEY